MQTQAAVDVHEIGDWDWAALRVRCLRETRRVLGASTAAEDATQEALIRAWRQRRSCQDPARPGPWISTIARREALRVAGSLISDDGGRDPSDDNGLLDAFDWSTATEVRSAVRQLEPEDRWLVFAHYWEDRPARDLSRELGCPEATVRVRLHRLRGRLNRVLAE
jgi:RNA polymerase sigma-70 factor (ECF subfamily)